MENQPAPVNNNGKKVHLAYILFIVFTYLVLAFIFPSREQPADADKSTSQRHPAFSEHEVPRSGKWRAVEKAHLKAHPACEACTYSGKGLQVHHVKPFHLFPELELDETNLITLCGPEHHNCHFNFGHAGVSYRAWNPHVREDAKRYHDRLVECKELLEKQK